MDSEKKANDIQSEMAGFISGLRYDRIPSQIIEDAKYRVLDWIGSALAGVRFQPAQIATDMIRSSGGATDATLIKGNAKVPVSQAAFANGIIGHVAEFDDGHRLAIAHPGAVTVPVAIAVTEGYGRSGKELLTAIIVGYEVLIRLGMAVNPSHYKIWHTTGTCGAFAAAASASSSLKLSPQRTQMALGIVGTMASGFLEKTLGTHAKPLNAGHACQSGVQAALLAMKGFTGPSNILTGEKGFIQATSPEFETKILEEINQGPLLSNTAFYKVYASCGHTNSPLDAVFMLMQEHDIPVQSIKQVQVEIYRTAVELTGQFRNSDEETAKFSLPYCIAAALLYKKVTLEEFTADKLKNPLIRELAGRIHVTEDLEATKVFPARRANIKIELADGRKFEKRVNSSNDIPKYSAIEEKFMSLAKTCVDHKAAQEIKSLVLDIDRLNKLDDLTELLK
jgi:2-methylcitrate dehydratase PrpD